MLVAREHVDGGVDVSRFVICSAPELDERSVLAGVLAELADAPADAELCSWGGAMHDIPLLVAGCVRHGLTLPPAWRWMPFGGGNTARHLDLLRIYTGGFKMKPVHQSEMLAALDLPGKLTAKPATIARLIEAGQWQLVREACEGDCVSELLLLARWRQLLDGRAGAAVVEDRILRRIIELMPGRGYVAALQSTGRALRCAMQQGRQRRHGARAVAGQGRGLSSACATMGARAGAEVRWTQFRVSAPPGRRQSSRTSWPGLLFPR